MKQCNECGSTDLEFEGLGIDEHGDYEEYICNECGESTIFPM